MNAATPPSFWALAMMCRVSVVLPLDSGPKIFQNASPRHADAAEGDIQAQRAGRMPSMG
jgi:hypothetical protein